MRCNFCRLWCLYTQVGASDETEMPEGLRTGSIFTEIAVGERGFENAVPTVFGFAGCSDASGGLLTSPGCGWRSNRRRLRLCRSSAGMRLWLLLILSIRVRALWVLWAAMVRRRRVHWRRPVVSRLLGTWLRLLRTRWVWLLRTWWLWLLRTRLLQTGSLRIPGGSWLWRWLCAQLTRRWLSWRWRRRGLPRRRTAVSGPASQFEHGWQLPAVFVCLMIPLRPTILTSKFHSLSGRLPAFPVAAERRAASRISDTVMLVFREDRMFPS